jgi:hypothetical protein
MNVTQQTQFQHQLIQAELLFFNYKANQNRLPIGLHLNIDSLLNELNNEPTALMKNYNKEKDCLIPVIVAQHCPSKCQSKKSYLTTLDSGAGKTYKVYRYY